jgi:hypothetical protein
VKCGGKRSGNLLRCSQFPFQTLRNGRAGEEEGEREDDGDGEDEPARLS